MIGIYIKKVLRKIEGWGRSCKYLGVWDIEFKGLGRKELGGGWR